MGWHLDGIDFETYRGFSARERVQLHGHITRLIRESSEEAPKRPKDMRR